MLRFVLSYSSHQPTKSRSEQCPGSRTVGSERRIGDPEVEFVLCECIIADVLNEIVVSSTWARADLNERFALLSPTDTQFRLAVPRYNHHNNGAEYVSALPIHLAGHSLSPSIPNRRATATRRRVPE